MADHPPTAEGVLTLRPSKRKWILVTLGSATFTAIGVAMALSDNPWWGMLSVAFFGPCMLIGLWTLVPGTSYLRIGPDGLETKTPLRTTRLSWNEVSDFRVYEVHTRYSKTRHVGYDLTDPAAHPRLVRLNRAVAGVEAGLPDTYGRSPEDLVQLLEAYRERYAGASAS